MEEVWRRFGEGLEEVWRRFGGGLEEVWRSFVGDLEEVWRRVQKGLAGAPNEMPDTSEKKRKINAETVNKNVQHRLYKLTRAT